MSIETHPASHLPAQKPPEPTNSVSEAELDATVNHGPYNLASAWVAMAGGLGMLAFHAYGFAPFWVGFLAGAAPTCLLFATMIGLGHRG